MSHDSASSSSTLDRLLESVLSRFTPEMIRIVVELQPPADVQARLDELASKNLQDELSTHERDEYEGVLQIVHALALLRAKALTHPAEAESHKDAPPPQPRIKEAVTLEDEEEAHRLEGLEAMLEDMDI